MALESQDELFKLLDGRATSSPDPSLHQASRQPSTTASSPDFASRASPSSQNSNVGAFGKPTAGVADSFAGLRGQTPDPLEPRRHLTEPATISSGGPRSTEEAFEGRLRSRLLSSERFAAPQQVEQALRWAEGDAVIVLEEFMSNNQTPKRLSAGVRGTVMGFDPDGDAEIDFVGVEESQFVQAAAFGNLAKVQSQAPGSPSTASPSPLLAPATVATPPPGRATPIATETIPVAAATVSVPSCEGDQFSKESSNSPPRAGALPCAPTPELGASRAHEPPTPPVLAQHLHPSAQLPGRAAAAASAEAAGDAALVAPTLSDDYASRGVTPAGAAHRAVRETREGLASARVAPKTSSASAGHGNPTASAVAPKTANAGALTSRPAESPQPSSPSGRPQSAESSSTTQEAWKTLTFDRIKHAKWLREEAEKEILMSCENKKKMAGELERGGEFVKDRLKKKMEATEELARALMAASSSVDDAWRRLGHSLFQLQRLFATTTTALSVAEERLRLRSERPQQEATRDHLQEALEHEQERLQMAQSRLQKRIDLTREFIVALEDIKSKMHVDMQRKRHANRVDKSGMNMAQCGLRRIVEPTLGMPNTSQTGASVQVSEPDRERREVDDWRRSAIELVEKAQMRERAARKYAGESDGEMSEIRREVSRNSAITVDHIRQRLKETIFLKRQIEHELRETEAAMYCVDREIQDSERHAGLNCAAKQVLEKSAQIRNKRAPTEKCRDSVCLNLEEFSIMAVEERRRLEDKTKMKREVLEKLREAKEIMLKDLQFKITAWKIDDKCLKVTPFTHADKGGSRHVEGNERAQNSSIQQAEPLQKVVYRNKRIGSPRPQREGASAPPQKAVCA